MDKLLIRVESTYEIGMGHFMRTLALAQKWQKEKGEVYFLINDNENLKERILNENMKYIINPHVTGSVDDKNFLISQIIENDISWVIIDGYFFKEDYFNTLHKKGFKFLIFDDDGKLSYYDANIVLNQNLHGKVQWYDFKKRDNTKVLIGADYVLLRNEFLDFLDYKKIIKNQATNILITLGGSDLNNYSLEILDSLNKVKLNNLEVILLIGPNNQHEDKLKEFVKNIELNVKILRNVSNMPEIMEWADLAFSSGGTTVWELAYMGVPTIVGATVPVEEVLINGLEEHDLFETIGHLKNLDKNNLSNIFLDLIQDYKTRQKMSNDGQKFIDGYGSERIINLME